MALEYRLALRLVHMPDFLEGVRASVIDRDATPHWQPASLVDVSASLLDAIFAPLGTGQGEGEWTPLSR
jgi:enoyl-CoA hydratase